MSQLFHGKILFFPSLLLIIVLWFTASTYSNCRSKSAVEIAPPAINGLRIFVYEIPEHILRPPFDVPNGPFRNEWAALELYFWQALLRSEFVTSNASEAQWFFIPHVTAMMYHASHLSMRNSSEHFAAVFNYVIHNYSYWNRSNGLDHVIVWAHDTFENVIAEVINTMPSSLSKNPVLITNQGHDASDGIRSQYVAQRDICVLPSAWSPMEFWQARNTTRRPWKDRKYLAVFRGSLHFENMYYSGGVRQRMFAMFNNESHDPEIIFGASSASYFEEMLEAKYCLFIRGWHVWSERMGTLVNAGCIPVIISDRYVLPFWQEINWREFSIRISEEKVLQPGKLQEILRSIPTDHAERAEAQLHQMIPQLTYNYPPRKGDAFYLAMKILASKTPNQRPVSHEHWTLPKR